MQEPNLFALRLIVPASEFRELRANTMRMTQAKSLPLFLKEVMGVVQTLRPKLLYL